MDWGRRFDKLLAREFVVTIILAVFGGMSLMNGQIDGWQFITLSLGLLWGYAGIKGARDVKMAQANGGIVHGNGG